jgi:F-type H+-transporting ATPase subunit b
MQHSDIISVNLWQIVVSLLNLLIIFLILKRFLFKPVKRILKSRQDAVDEKYAQAENAVNDAEAKQIELTKRLENAQAEAESIIKDATVTAERRREKIENEARENADSIIRQAKNEAELEKKKAESEIKEQIVVVSTALTEKLIEREIKEEDHHKLIDSFIAQIGDGDEE